MKKQYQQPKLVSTKLEPCSILCTSYIEPPLGFGGEGGGFGGS